MTKTIAIAGKGGTGKTLVAALLIKLLSQKGLVLAVDADASTNLNSALGLPLEINGTIGQVREKLTEDIAKGRISPSIAKQDYLFGKIMESLVESKGFDLLAIGRPEGPGCYCAPNEFLRSSLDRLVKGYKYDYIVMDCEAGMEHISRQTTRDVDILLIMSDPTIRGITVAARIRDLIKELRTKVGKISLVVNRVNGKLPSEIEKAIIDSRLELITTIPEDPNMANLEIKGRPVIELPQDSPLRLKVKEIAKSLLLA
jgi:CO dehydrogenase maturation factor